MSDILGNITNLASLYQYSWDQLQRAALDPKHAFREICLATSDEGEAVDQRMVILRFAQRSSATIHVYSDVRAAKIAQIRANSSVHILAWDSRKRLQIRCKATATLHHNDRLSQQAWQSLSTNARSLYSADPAPGKVVSLSEGFAAYEHQPETDTDTWETNFGLISLQVEEMECLVLRRTKHLRARYLLSNDWKGNWLVP
ncbi:MAG: pyridoxamine 5'-phosphate oxidase family protein [Bacteroidota bacterium]